MTVPNTIAGVVRIGDGVVTVFGFPFQITSAEQIRVADIGAEQQVVDRPEADYTVSMNPGGTGGEVTFVLPVATAQKIYIYRATEQTQLVSVTSQQRYDPKVTMAVWDRLTFMVQELNAKTNRAILAAPDADPQELLTDVLLAQQYSATALSVVEFLQSLAYGETHSYTVTEATDTIPLAFDPGAHLLDVNNGLPQRPGADLNDPDCDYIIVAMEASPSGVGIRFDEVQPVGTIITYSAVRPIPFDPNLNRLITLPSRAALVSNIAEYGAIDGETYFDGEVFYLGQSGATGIVDLPGLIRLGGLLATDLTILVPSDHATVQAALDAASRIALVAGKTATILIESGHALTHGWTVQHADLRRVRIAAQDAIVYTVPTGFIPVSSAEVPESSRAIAYYKDCVAPRLSCLIEGHGGSDYDGIICFENVILQVDPGCGVQNTRMNFEMRQGGDLSANASLWSKSRRACMRLTNGVKFSVSGAAFDNGWTSWTTGVDAFTDASLHISRGSVGQAQDVAIGDGGAACVTVRRSYVSIIQAQLGNCGLLSGNSIQCIRPLDGAVIAANRCTYNGAPITEAAGGSNNTFNQPSPSGIIFNEAGAINTGVGALGGNLPLRDSDLDYRMGFQRWSGAEWGPSPDAGGVLSLMRDNNRGAVIASRASGSLGQNRPRLYAKSTSGIVSDWGPWEEMLHTGNTGETFESDAYRRKAIVRPGGTASVMECSHVVELLSVAITTAEGGLFRSDPITISFPDAFSVTPNVMVSPRNSSGSGGVFVRAISPNAAGFAVSFYSTVSTTVATLRLTYSAVGMSA